MTAIVTILIIVGVLVGLVLFVIGIYNGLVKFRNRYKNAFAQIDVQLKRRYDLIPNLVETAKTYMKHEKETLTAVIEARNMAKSASDNAAANVGDAGAMEKLASAEAGLGGVLGRMFALSEGYPDLKANQNMMQFQEELASTENKVAFARQAFNDAVMSYNNGCQNFPNSLIANNFNFKHAEFLEIEQEEKREVPKVSFNQ